MYVVYFALIILILFLVYEYYIRSIKPNRTELVFEPFSNIDEEEGDYVNEEDDRMGNDEDVDTNETKTTKTTKTEKKNENEKENENENEKKKENDEQDKLKTGPPSSFFTSLSNNVNNLFPLDKNIRLKDIRALENQIVDANKNIARYDTERLTIQDMIKELDGHILVLQTETNGVQDEYDKLKISIQSIDTLVKAYSNKKMFGSAGGVGDIGDLSLSNVEGKKGELMTYIQSMKTKLSDVLVNFDKSNISRVKLIQNQSKTGAMDILNKVKEYHENIFLRLHVESHRNALCSDGNNQNDMKITQMLDSVCGNEFNLMNPSSDKRKSDIALLKELSKKVCEAKSDTCIMERVDQNTNLKSYYTSNYGYEFDESKWTQKDGCTAKSEQCFAFENLNETSACKDKHQDLYFIDQIDSARYFTQNFGSKPYLVQDSSDYKEWGCEIKELDNGKPTLRGAEDITDVEVIKQIASSNCIESGHGYGVVAYECVETDGALINPLRKDLNNKSKSWNNKNINKGKTTYGECLINNTCRTETDVLAEIACLQKPNNDGDMYNHNWNCFSTSGDDKTNIQKVDESKYRKKYTKGKWDDAKMQWVSNNDSCIIDNETCRTLDDADAHVACLKGDDNWQCHALSHEPSATNISGVQNILNERYYWNKKYEPLTAAVTSSNKGKGTCITTPSGGECRRKEDVDAEIRCHTKNNHVCWTVDPTNDENAIKTNDVKNKYTKPSPNDSVEYVTKSTDGFHEANCAINTECKSEAEVRGVSEMNRIANLQQQCVDLSDMCYTYDSPTDTIKSERKYTWNPNSTQCDAMAPCGTEEAAQTLKDENACKAKDAMCYFVENRDDITSKLQFNWDIDTKTCMEEPICLTEVDAKQAQCGQRNEICHFMDPSNPGMVTSDKQYSWDSDISECKLGRSDCLSETEALRMACDANTDVCYLADIPNRSVKTELKHKWDGNAVCVDTPICKTMLEAQGDECIARPDKCYIMDPNGNTPIESVRYNWDGSTCIDTNPCQSKADVELQILERNREACELMSTKCYVMGTTDVPIESTQYSWNGTACTESSPCLTLEVVNAQILERTRNACNSRSERCYSIGGSDTPVDTPKYSWDGTTCTDSSPCLSLEVVNDQMAAQRRTACVSRSDTCYTTNGDNSITSQPRNYTMNGDACTRPSACQTPAQACATKQTTCYVNGGNSSQQRSMVASGNMCVPPSGCETTQTFCAETNYGAWSYGTGTPTNWNGTDDPPLCSGKTYTRTRTLNATNCVNNQNLPQTQTQTKTTQTCTCNEEDYGAWSYGTGTPTSWNGTDDPPLCSGKTYTRTRTLGASQCVNNQNLPLTQTNTKTSQLCPCKEEDYDVSYAYSAYGTGETKNGQASATDWELTNFDNNSAYCNTTITKTRTLRNGLVCTNALQSTQNKTNTAPCLRYDLSDIFGKDLILLGCHFSNSSSYGFQNFNVSKTNPSNMKVPARFPTLVTSINNTTPVSTLISRTYNSDNAKPFVQIHNVSTHVGDNVYDIGYIMSDGRKLYISSTSQYTNRQYVLASSPSSKTAIKITPFSFYLPKTKYQQASDLKRIVTYSLQSVEHSHYLTFTNNGNSAQWITLNKNNPTETPHRLPSRTYNEKRETAKFHFTFVANGYPKSFA
jgi:hypothetical protein